MYKSIVTDSDFMNVKMGAGGVNVHFESKKYGIFIAIIQMRKMKHRRCTNYMMMCQGDVGKIL